MWKKIASIFSVILIVIPIAVALFNANSNKQASGNEVYSNKKINHLGQYSFGNTSLIKENDREKGYYVQNETLHTPEITYKVGSVKTIENKKKLFLNIQFNIKNTSHNSVRVYENRLPYKFMQLVQGNSSHEWALKLAQQKSSNNIDVNIPRYSSVRGNLTYKLVNKESVSIEMLDKQENKIGSLKFNLN